MIALSYGMTYIWGTVGIILICKYLPRWWGVDAKAAAKKYEDEYGVRNVDGGGLTGYRPFGAARLPAAKTETRSARALRQFRSSNPEYRIVNVARGERDAGRRSPTWCCRRAT